MERTIENIAVEIRNVSKCYGKKKAIENISFKVRRGEIMGFLGPNGAGKSTTMNIITGYFAASSGDVLIDGINIAENPIAAKRKIGYLPEIPPIYNDMTVLEYLDFVYALKDVAGNRKLHLKNIMEKVRIFDVRRRIIRNLSKGYKQRVGLAQALIGDPDVLILDEPTVGLDPAQIMEIREVISELGRDRTVILSTHIMQEVLAVCDSYTIINRGKIVASGSMEEFKGGGVNGYSVRAEVTPDEIQKILEQVQEIESFEVLGNFEENTTDVLIIPKPNYDIRKDIFNLFVKANITILSFSPRVRSLEESFVQAISREEAID